MIVAGCFIYADIKYALHSEAGLISLLMLVGLIIILCATQK